MDFWETPEQPPARGLAAPRVPEQAFSNTLQSVFDEPGYGAAFAALTNANRKVRVQRDKKTGRMK